MSKRELTADKYSIVQGLLAAPLYAIGELYAKAIGASGEERIHLLRSAVQRFNKIIAFLMVLWLFLLLRTKAEWNFREASIAGLFLLFGSILIPHAKDFYSECLWTLLCVHIVTMLSHFGERPLENVDERVSILFALLVSLAISLNPLLLAVFGLLLLQLTSRRLWAMSPGTKRNILPAVLKADVVLLCISLPVGASLCVFENWIRRGSLWDFGYPGEGFSTPFLTGFIGQLVSPARGVVFFMPTFLCGLIVALKFRGSLDPMLRRLVTTSLLFCGFLLLAYSKWHAWHGAWHWGPRFLLPLSVFGCLYFALLVKLWLHDDPWKSVFLILTALVSFMVYKVGVSIGQGPLIACLEAHSNASHCYWRWHFTPLASWFNASDVFSMLTDRSTAVEIIGGLLALPLLWRAPSSSFAQA
ncbi:MAG: hypothetical protein GY722_12685 [bacterium]|nr:hypothetical protein [bacterium]